VPALLEQLQRVSRGQCLTLDTCNTSIKVLRVRRDSALARPASAWRARIFRPNHFKCHGVCLHRLRAAEPGVNDANFSRRPGAAIKCEALPAIGTVGGRLYSGGVSGANTAATPAATPANFLAAPSKDTAGAASLGPEAARVPLRQDLIEVLLSFPLPREDGAGAGAGAATAAGAAIVSRGCAYCLLRSWSNG